MLILMLCWYWCWYWYLHIYTSFQYTAYMKYHINPPPPLALSSSHLKLHLMTHHKPPLHHGALKSLLTQPLPFSPYTLNLSSRSSKKLPRTKQTTPQRRSQVPTNPTSPPLTLHLKPWTFHHGPRKNYTTQNKLPHSGALKSAWHDVPLYASGSSGLVNFIVEIPMYSTAKMEMMKDVLDNPIMQDTKDNAPRYVLCSLFK